ncbi:MAG: DUF4292 domain-containing protein [Thermodesulfobacteriota bacterium]
MRLFYILVLIFSIGSCAPKIAPVNFENLDVDNILEEIQRENSEINTLQGIARVRAKNNFDNVSIRQVTVVETPYMFRLEALAAFGQSLAVVTSNGQQVVFKTRGEEVVFDDVKQFNLTYFYPGIPDEIKTKELIDLLLGKVPFGLWGEDYEISFNDNKNLLVVKYINSNKSQTVLYLDPVKEHVKAADIVIDDENIMHIDYSEYKNFGNLKFPKKISLIYISNEIKISYEKDLILNKQIDAGLFLN